MRFPVQKPLRIHFIGIGGIGMSALAYALAMMGHRISGSDIREDFYTKRFLMEAGIKIYTGHYPSNIDGGIDIGVVSTAISPANSEFRELLRRNIPVVHRSHILGAFTKANTTIGITGAHGKTTLTYYVSKILLDALYDPSIIIGSTMRELEGNNVRVGGNLLVAEIDESDKSLLNTYPDYTIIHSIDIEHMDHYSSYEDIFNTFQAYAEKTPWWGNVFINAAYNDLRRMGITISSKGKNIITYSLDAKHEQADYIGVVKGNSMNVFFRGNKLASFSLKYPTLYNYENALAAFAVTHVIGVSPKVIAQALEHADMPGRRLEYKGTYKEAIVIEDYAHHPREIESLLSGIKQMYPNKKVWAVLQPHRYTRVKSLWNEFREVISKFDKALVMPIYAASEKPIDGISTEQLIRNLNNANLVNWNNIVDTINQLLKEHKGNDVVIVLIGAGDVYKVWDLLRKS